MRLVTILTWLAGLGLLAGLLASNDLGALLQAVWRLQWWLVVIAAYHAVPLMCDVLGWRLLFARQPALGRLLRIRWIGEAANGLLPVPHLGEVLRVKLSWDEGSDLTDSAASVMADVTLGLLTQVLFIATGLVLFSLRQGAGTLYRSLAVTAVLMFFAVGFYAAQRSRLFSRAAQALGRGTGSAWHLFNAAGIRRVEDALRRVYGQISTIIAALLWRLASWFAGAGEIWLVSHCLGGPLDFGDAVALESLRQGARAAAFIIPGGLGVQDGTLMILTAQLGFGAELGLVISLVKRLRELALGLPALALLWAGETQRWRRRRTA